MTRAIELNPSLAAAHHGYANYLSYMGEIDSAIVEIRRAQRLDPVSPIITGDVAVRFIIAGQPDSAIVEANKSLELVPDFAPSLWALGAAYKMKGMYAEAIVAHEKAVSINPIFRFNLAHTYAVAGRIEPARRILAGVDEGTRQRQPYVIALAYAGLGETDQVFRWLDAAYVARDRAMNFLNVEWRFDSVRPDRRFQDLLRRMGFPN